MATVAAIVGLLGLGTALAGCLDPENPTQRSATPIIPASCQLFTPDWCTTEGSTTIIESLYLAAQERRASEIGLHIRETSGSVIIRNSTITGFPFGIVVEFPECTSCRLVLENVVLDAADAQVPSTDARWNHTTALWDIRVPGTPVMDLFMRNVTIRGYQQATQVLTGGTGAAVAGEAQLVDVTVKCDQEGLRITRLQVRLERVHVAGCEGIAADVGSAEQLIVRDSTFERSRLGLQFHSSMTGSLQIDESKFLHNDGGGLFVWAQTHEIQRSLFLDNGAFTRTTPNDYMPLDRAFGLALISAGTVNASCFEQNPAWGIYALDIQPMRGNWWGDAAGPRVGVEGDHGPRTAIGVGQGDIVTAGVVDAAPAASRLTTCPEGVPTST